MKEMKSGNQDMMPYQALEWEKQKNKRYNWNQPGIQNAYSKFQLSCQKRVQYSPLIRKTDIISQKLEVEEVKNIRKPVQSYIQSSEKRKEVPKGKKHSEFNPAIQSQSFREDQPLQQETKNITQKSFEASKSIYEQKRGVKMFDKNPLNPITQGIFITSEEIKIPIKVPRFPAEPSKELTRKHEKEFFLGGGQAKEKLQKQVLNRTFVSNVFNSDSSCFDNSPKKQSSRKFENKNDTVGGILKYDNGPQYRIKEISKPSDQAPNQIAKVCKQLVKEKIENNAYQWGVTSGVWDEKMFINQFVEFIFYKMWKTLGSKVKELRFIMCNTSEIANGQRTFIQNNYLLIKKEVPDFPFIVREAEGAQGFVMARYDFGVERKIWTDNMNEQQVKKAVDELVA